ncbi:MAG: trypsin-like peptidase domain-containing protein, partial [bacterium]
MRRSTLSLFVCLSLLPLSSLQADTSPTASVQAPAVPAPSAALLLAQDGFTRVAEMANPWVVNISTTQIIHQRIASFWDNFYGFSPFNQGGIRTFTRQSLGSGFIYSADGLILTNAHVVSGADEITVGLVDGTEAKAQVVGEDDNVDLALLKINVGHPLPFATLGDSDKVKVGQWAIAIGNPFGLDHSLTVGVISAKERTNIFSGEGAAKYQNYLQTDASINHGNSGGPLCDIEGNVIGMNTAITTPNDGSIGIGFAIPANFIKRSIPDLERAGRVVAPELGFFTQDVDARLARALKLPTDHGVLVTDVAAGGAADKAGLRRGDVLLKLNDKDVPDTATLRMRIYENGPGQAISLDVWRGGQTLSLSVTADQLKASEHPETWHGIKVIANSNAIAAKRGLSVTQGVVVDSVAPSSSAERIGIRPGDVLLELNQQNIQSLENWKKLTQAVDESQD